ncbi:MAG: methenyltetrahydromethanopterin cyclohydrolase [Pirellulales bacterium]
MITDLNRRATLLTQAAAARADELRISVSARGDSGQTLDFGIDAQGGLAAGRALAEICLAGLGQVAVVPAGSDLPTELAVTVLTDEPVAACLRSQYAGWQVTGEKYFAMGSGPMRAASGREDVVQHLGGKENADSVVGVLETHKTPPAAVVAEIAAKCGVKPADVTLAVAPTASFAGTIQIVARSVETALHKLHELGFDVRRIVSGHGVAPLPPVGRDDLKSIGWTNDAVLYGGTVTLWLRGDDESLAEIGPRVPSCSSNSHGQPFARLFEQAGGDFYKLDPHLFSPAVVVFVNIDSGRTFRFGRLEPEVLRSSFGLGAARE